MKKVMVLISEAGEVIAAHIPPERQGSSLYGPDEPPSGRFVPSEGQEVLDLELPDEEVPSEPRPDFLEKLQRHTDSGR